jgi:hypothetical protein
MMPTTSRTALMMIAATRPAVLVAGLPALHERDDAEDQRDDWMKNDRMNATMPIVLPGSVAVQRRRRAGGAARIRLRAARRAGAARSGGVGAALAARRSRAAGRNVGVLRIGHGKVLSMTLCFER